MAVWAGGNYMLSYLYTEIVNVCVSWALASLDIWTNVILGVSVRSFLA